MASLPAGAAAALAALHSRDSSSLHRTFQHLTAARLEQLEADLGLSPADAALLLATAVLRRTVHRLLDKHVLFGDVGAAVEQVRCGYVVCDVDV